MQSGGSSQNNSSGMNEPKCTALSNSRAYMYSIDEVGSITDNFRRAPPTLQPFSPGPIIGDRDQLHP